MEYLLIIISAIFVNNILRSQFLGICPFLGVSNKLSTMDSILSTATHFILKKYKDHGTILTKKYEDTRERVSP